MLTIHPTGTREARSTIETKSSSAPHLANDRC